MERLTKYRRKLKLPLMCPFGSNGVIDKVMCFLPLCVCVCRHLYKLTNKITLQVALHYASFTYHYT